MLNVRQRREAEARRKVQELVGELGGPDRVAQALGVSLDTARRWAEARVTPSPVVIVALEAHLGRLPGMGKSWEGWRVGQDGMLYAPGYPHGYHAGHILGLHFLHQLVAHQKRQIALLERKLREVDTGAANDPVEGDIARPGQPRLRAGSSGP